MPDLSNDTPTTASPPPVRRAPRAQRRSQILEAALRCFARHGYHGTTMDALVRESGLSKGSLYWHFESKLDVALALFDALAEAIFERWEDAARERATAPEVLREALFGTLAALSGERDRAGVWLEFFAIDEARERIAAVYATSRAKLARVVADGMARGELRAVDPQATAAALVGLGEGLALQAMVDPDFDVLGCSDALWALVERGLVPS